MFEACGKAWQGALSPSAACTTPTLAAGDSICQTCCSPFSPNYSKTVSLTSHVVIFWVGAPKKGLGRNGGSLLPSITTERAGLMTLRGQALGSMYTAASSRHNQVKQYLIIMENSLQSSVHDPRVGL